MGDKSVEKEKKKKEIGEKMVDMVNRELTKREREIYDMIPDNTDGMASCSIVEIVRRDVDASRYNARKGLKYLNNQ